MVKVSVVVPARNEAARIRACLRALLSQDYPREAYEVIVVDDGSTDGTAEVAAGFGVSVVRQPPLGGAAARNAGIAHARGQVVAFTDADCVPARDWLRRLVEPFEEADVAGCAGDVAGSGESLVARYVDEAGVFRLATRMRARPWPNFVTANVAYRRAVFDALGGFDPALAAASDMEMSWRIARDGRFRVVPCPSAVVHHMHPSTVRGLCQQWFGYGAGRARLLAKTRGTRATLAEGVRQAFLALASAGTAPVRALRRLLTGRGAGRVRVAFPLLDAARSLAFAAGYWSAACGRLPQGSWRERAALGSRPGEGRT